MSDASIKTYDASRSLAVVAKYDPVKCVCVCVCVWGGGGIRGIDLPAGGRILHGEDNADGETGHELDHRAAMTNRRAYRE